MMLHSNIGLSQAQFTDCHGCLCIYSAPNHRVKRSALRFELKTPRSYIKVISAVASDTCVVSDVAMAGQEALALARAAAQAARDAVALADDVLFPSPSSYDLSILEFPTETDWLTLERARLTEMEKAGSTLLPDSVNFLEENGSLVIWRDGRGRRVHDDLDSVLVEDEDPKALKGEGEGEAVAATKSKRHSERLMKRQRAMAKAAAQAGAVIPVPAGKNGKSHSRSNRFKKSKLLTASEEVELALAVQDLLALEADRSSFQEQMGRDPTLLEWAKASGMEIGEFSKRRNHGRICKDRMIQSNLRLVASVARKYQGRGISLPDLIQEGSLGLIRGCEKFDPLKGFKFSTYAHWWIRQSITKSIAEHSRTVRIPVHLCEVIPRIVKARRMLQEEHKRAPREEEVAEVVGISVEKLRMVLRASKFGKSMDRPIGHDQTKSFGDCYADENIEDPELAITKQLLKRDTEKVLSTLKPREKEVVRLRYGIADGQVRTLEQIGCLFGVTRERIRQIEVRAMRKLRLPERNRILQGYSVNE